MKLPKSRRVADAIAVVCEKYAVTEESILFRSKRRDITQNRHEVFWLARSMGASLNEISDYFGMDPTTVIHGCKAFAKRERG